MGDVRQQSYFTVVQALRGLAALWVVLFHLSEGGHIADLKIALPQPVSMIIFEAGHLGVPIFFALSGFVIAHSIAGVSVTPSFFGRFILRRSIRLDPAYWAAIILAVGLSAMSAVAKGSAIEFPSAQNIVSHLIYAQVVTDQSVINPAFWTLTYEVQFYLFFVGLLVLHDRWARSGPLVPASMFALAVLSAFGVFDSLPGGLFLPLWASFYVGALAASAHRASRALLGLIALATCLCLSTVFGQASAATAVFLFASVRLGFAGTALNWRWLQFLGAISYSLYLVHSPVTGAAAFIVRKVIGSGLFSDIVSMVVSVCASLIAALIFWFCIERPSHRLAKSIPVQSPKRDDLRTLAP